MKIKLPTTTFILRDINPTVVNLTIQVLKLAGVPIYSDTKVFDSAYPHLRWDGSKICQYTDINNCIHIIINTAEGFIAQFVVSECCTLELNDKNEYKAKVYADRVEVGCQTITKAKVEEILSTMAKLS